MGVSALPCDFDSGGGAERSQGSRKNSSAHPSFGQIVARGVARCAPDTSKAWIRSHGRSAMQIKKHDRSHMVELRDGSAWRIWPGDIPKSLQRLPMSRTSRTKSVRTRWSIARTDRECE